MELVLVLPVVALFLLAIVQIGVVSQAEVVTVHAAREGARAAAVGSSAAEVREAVLRRSSFPADRVNVTVSREATVVVVEVRYRQATSVPLVGAVVGDAEHTARAVMRREDVE